MQAQPKKRTVVVDHQSRQFTKAQATLKKWLASNDTDLAKICCDAVALHTTYFPQDQQEFKIHFTKQGFMHPAHIPISGRNADGIYEIPYESAICYVLTEHFQWYQRTQNTWHRMSQLSSDDADLNNG